MSKVVKCSVIIRDDFNNVLIAERGKGKKDSPKQWSIIGKEMKGKENEEACVSKAVDKNLGCTIFDLTPFKEYSIREENDEIQAVFTGRIREMVTLHKEINKVKWISKRELDNYDFAVGEKEIVLDYFNAEK